MTNDQFDALAQLAGRPDPTPSQHAARLHLVEGVRLTDAAHLADCGVPAASNAVQRIRARLRLARRAAGVPG